MRADLNASNSQQGAIVQYKRDGQPSLENDDKSMVLQLITVYLLLKLCKEKELNMSCFANMITKLLVYSFVSRNRMDRNLLQYSSIPHSVIERVNSVSYSLNNLLQDMRSNSFICDLVLSFILSDFKDDTINSFLNNDTFCPLSLSRFHSDFDVFSLLLFNSVHFTSRFWCFWLRMEGAATS